MKSVIILLLLVAVYAQTVTEGEEGMTVQYPTVAEGNEGMNVKWIATYPRCTCTFTYYLRVSSSRWSDSGTLPSLILEPNHKSKFATIIGVAKVEATHQAVSGTSGNYETSILITPAAGVTIFKEHTFRGRSCRASGGSLAVSIFGSLVDDSSRTKTKNFCFSAEYTEDGETVKSAYHVKCTQPHNPNRDRETA